ncbi:MAG: hypothetical protein J5736_00770, partial [Bacilli bacterium]|nr:hypothetical protein [Bacilli bacterium]
LSPVIGEGVDYAKGSYRSPYGEIKVAWKKEGEEIVFDIDVPVNAKASFHFLQKAEQLEPGKHHFTVKV